MIPHQVTTETREDGAILMRSELELGPVARVASDWLETWASAEPGRVFLAERSGDGWREITYAEAWEMVQGLAAGLLEQDLGPQKPLMILSGNSVDHGLVSLAAHHVGIPTVPLAEQYSLVRAAHPRLGHAKDLTAPGAVFAADAEAYSDAIELCALPTITSSGGRQTINLQALLKSQGDVAGVHKTTGPDTVAKILMTSGSTSAPKGVVTTQKMMTTNQAQIRACLPFLGERPPVMVDWLPWNHVFGGSHNFNMALANGGTIYIDDGKPLPSQFPRTLENLARVAGTISFNVPVGFAQLVRALREDADLRATYFSNLDMIFYAGADLPQETWLALEDLAREEGRAPLINSSWGLTETSPGALIQHEPVSGESRIGVPMPGLTLKLLELGNGRFEARVSGDTIFTEYLGQPEKTADAFDDEGFFITGDAMKFAVPDDPARGMRFDGRLSEDFKLASGTWVRAATLRLELLDLLAPLVSDLVICGAGREELGLLLIPNRAALEAAGLTLDDSGPVCLPLAALAERLQPAAAPDRGSARRIARVLIASAPPSMPEGEMTAKGNLNIPRFLQTRADLVARLFDESDPAVMRLGA